jgi:Xaa-Pro dipeptidase
VSHAPRRFVRTARTVTQRAAAAAAIALLSACGAAPQPPPTGEDRPFDAAVNPWPEIRAERIRVLLPEAMARAGIDAWVIIARENNNDPLAVHIGAENAGGTAAFLFLADPFAAIAISPAGEATALREAALHDVRVIPQGESVWGELAALLDGADPARIAVNSSALAVADGLSYTQRRELEAALGPRLAARLVSADELVYEWLSVKLPAEIEILRLAAELTDALQREAYAFVVPGETRDSDIARYLKRRMEELGLEDAWAPAQNPNVNSGADRGHSHATDRVIAAGDFIQTDFGIRVWGMWVTDVQRFAYVLAPGESSPPVEAQRRWEAARAGGRAAFATMRPGARGIDVDRAQRAVMEREGSLPVFWNTGHPVGYWAHDVGPSLGGGQANRRPSPYAFRELRPGQTFAFDGFFSWDIEGDDGAATKTISVEEMVVITETGAEYLVPPQDELILIRSRR